MGNACSAFNRLYFSRRCGRGPQGDPGNQASKIHIEMIKYKYLPLERSYFSQNTPLGGGEKPGKQAGNVECRISLLVVRQGMSNVEGE